jgi:multicomponent Na+:H+ antiporter subunit F
MTSFLIVVAGFVLALLALGLVCVLRGPAAADRMMSAQLLGTSGIAALLLLSAAIDDSAIADVALALALLAAFASVAFVMTYRLSQWAGMEAGDGDEHRA